MNQNIKVEIESQSKYLTATEMSSAFSIASRLKALELEVANAQEYLNTMSTKLEEELEVQFPGKSNPSSMLSRITAVKQEIPSLAEKIEELGDASDEIRKTIDALSASNRDTFEKIRGKATKITDLTSSSANETNEENFVEDNNESKEDWALASDQQSVKDSRTSALEMETQTDDFDEPTEHINKLEDFDAFANTFAGVPKNVRQKADAKYTHELFQKLLDHFRELPDAKPMTKLELRKQGIAITGKMGTDALSTLLFLNLIKQTGHSYHVPDEVLF